MSALKQIPFFLILILVITGCGSDESADLVKGTDEQLPKVDASKFRNVKTDAFEVSVLKKMSLNRTSGDLILSANYLPEEYHFEIYSIPHKRFKHDDDFPSDKGKRLEWFANQHSKKLQNRIETLDQEPMQMVASNKQECFKKTLTGKEFGFPIAKTYFLRYYEMDENFIAIVSWTTHFNANKFEKFAQYMGMKFQS